MPFNYLQLNKASSSGIEKSHYFYLDIRSKNRIKYNYVSNFSESFNMRLTLSKSASGRIRTFSPTIVKEMHYFKFIAAMLLDILQRPHL